MKKNEKEKRRYEAPQLTAVSFQPERGFAGSPLLTTLIINSEADAASSSESYDYAGDLWSY